MSTVLVVVCKSQAPRVSRLASPLFVASRKSLVSPLFVVAHDVCVVLCCGWVCSSVASVASVAMCGARSNLVLKLRRMTSTFTNHSRNKNRFRD
eukprot:scaffold216751_cov63-Attheya_sp.AAC.1